MAHVVIDGGLDGERLRSQRPELVRERGEDGLLDVDAVAEAYWRLHVQPRSAWLMRSTCGRSGSPSDARGALVLRAGSAIMGRRAVASKRETIMSRSLGLMACLTMCCLCTAAQAADSDDQQVGQAFGNDQFVAGRVFARIDRGVAGDLIAAGGRVEIEAPVSGDALVAGGDIRVGGNIGNGMYAAGSQVTIDATVGRNARVAGGRVKLSCLAGR